MKHLKLLYLLVATIVVVPTIQAQLTSYSTFGNTIIGETELQHDGNANPAFVINFEGNHNDLAKSWSSFLKDSYGIKLKKSGKLQIAPNVNLADITSKMITVYSMVNAKAPDAGLIVAISTNRYDFISRDSHPAEYEKIEAFIKRFAKYYNLQLVDEELADIQKAYDKMNGELVKVEKDKADIDKDVIDLEGDILKAGSDVSKKQKQILELEAEIATLNNDVLKYKGRISELSQQSENVIKDISTHKEKLSMQKEKIDKINAKKDLILSE